MDVSVSVAQKDGGGILSSSLVRLMKIDDLLVKVELSGLTVQSYRNDLDLISHRETFKCHIPRNLDL